ncbi:hypothetical protein MMC13_007269 [Lambiella insularis]|nr:hypothetical protein [Lambiella insularis]
MDPKISPHSALFCPVYCPDHCLAKCWALSPESIQIFTQFCIADQNKDTAELKRLSYTNLMTPKKAYAAFMAHEKAIRKCKPAAVIQERLDKYKLQQGRQREKAQLWRALRAADKYRDEMLRVEKVGGTEEVETLDGSIGF